ncbi:MAG: M20/M25/M40 family metallo-hydrolase [Gammaproteobacteria bacterium]|nr:M20/M25/M40 family metallo-hydrolase [Gammaproteobacteria bacterium]NIR83355.1 M20/M25/M40 family metallo-hydrolase [Gammaproteobacteria bacterium]NIR91155.1 M20/M25/M40 family metallo-hydrolase [Gammaproteobacteria bacterium]NIU04522.1 M20/M25/M40 family metallo-hydrolase [Gammaproteobacteria bacterium]NIW87158.1 M20/M25/M40 family metallo-hydrolase [Gammaproteobacteria bacterium]
MIFINMPGRSYTGPLPPLSPHEARLRDNLRAHVATLAGDIGERNLWRYTALEAAAGYIHETLASAGYAVLEQPYTVDGKTVRNLEVVPARVSRTGQTPEEIVVIGGHYDTVPGSPGANDNATGVAAVLELARLLSGQRLARTLRLVAFVNEERPFAHTEHMGSLVYARRAASRGERIAAMLSLETIGYYSDQARTQRYPAPLSLFYPDTGNFIGFVGNVGSRKLVRRAIASFRRHTRFPSEGTAAPAWLPGIGWSDHWSFWQQGYPAIMVTDTAPFRYAQYHTPADRPERIDYDRLARVVAGVARVVGDLTNDGTPASTP